MTTYTITGRPAISVAELLGLTLEKYADPTEDARTGLAVDEARVVARQDPSLIWVDTAEVAEAIDDERIEALRQETSGRDDMQRLICERALDTSGEWILEDEMRRADRLTVAQEAALRNMRRQEARARCALAIATSGGRS